MTLRILIVDDSRLARQELRTLLAAIADVECIGEADDVPAAREAICRLSPDVVLLDIQMPSGTGFDVIDGLDPAPQVIFTTAYDQYALRGFEANALDYLLKPVQADRLEAALARARPARAEGRADARCMLRADDQVFLRDGERCWFVQLGQVSRIEVDGNYATVYFRSEKAMLGRSLATLKSRLDPALFFRANRHTLVNLRLVQGVDLSISEGYTLTMKDGAAVEVSRRQARELRERLAL
jgi:two-component system LytT family response regulator